VRKAIASIALVAPLGAAHADCRLELELLGAALSQARATISQAQGQQLAPFVEDALRYCRTGHEAQAVRAIERARAIAGVPKRDALEPESETATLPDR
jgi:hypothetical protein